MLEINKTYDIGLKTNINYRGALYSDLSDVTLVEDRDDQYVFSIKNGKLLMEIPVMKEIISSYYEKVPVKDYWYLLEENVYEKASLTANEAKINKKAGVKLLSYDAMKKEAEATSKTGVKVVFTLDKPYVYINGTKPFYIYKGQFLNGKESYLN